MHREEESNILGTGHLYGFDPMLKHWTSLFQKEDFLSDFALPNDIAGSGPLSTLMKTYGSTTTDDLTEKNIYSSIHRELFISTYLETQIHRSRVLQSNREYRFWLTSFVRFLAASSLEDKSLKLKSILDDLAEHIHTRSSSSSSSSLPSNSIPLKSKDDYQSLLNECLTILRQHDDASSLLQHYQDGAF